MKEAYLLLAVLLIVPGCSGAGGDDPAALGPPPEPVSSISLSSELPPGDPQALATALVSGTSELMEIALTREDWSRADADTRAYLRAADPGMEPALRETAAIIMLENHLLGGSSSPEKNEATAFYRDVLVEAGNSRTDLVQAANQKLATE